MRIEDNNFAPMRISANGIALLKRFEGLELDAYQDIAGVWTIGYGHTGVYPPGMSIDGAVKAGDRISEEEAEPLLRHDLCPREAAVLRLVKVPLNQNEFDALVSFVYNVGVAAFRRSTALRRLNRGDSDGAAEALTWWNKATVDGKLREVLGLTRRRAAEKALFLTEVSAASAPAMETALDTLPMKDDDPRESNACPAKEARPLTAYFPTFIQECFA